MEEYGYNTRYMRNFEKQSERALHDTEFMSQFVEGYSNALQGAQDFFTSEGFLKELGKSAGILVLRAIKIEGLVTTVKGATSYAKNRRWVDELLTLSKIENADELLTLSKIENADELLTLAKTKYANKVTAKGVGLEWLKKGTAKLVNKVARKELIKVSIGNIIKAGTKTAKGLLGLESAISIGFGIWDTIKGAKKIREGSSLSDEFRKAIGPLDEEKDKIIEFWSLINNKP